MGFKTRDEELRPTFKREVPEVLDNDAAIALADQATRKAARANELEDELKEHTTKMKATIKELRGEAERDHAASEKRTRMVVAECREELRGSQMFVLRVDTGEVVDQRAATLAERQQDFPGLDHGGSLPRPGQDDDARGNRVLLHQDRGDVVLEQVIHHRPPALAAFRQGHGGGTGDGVGHAVQVVQRQAQAPEHQPGGFVKRIGVQ